MRLLSVRGLLSVMLSVRGLVSVMLSGRGLLSDMLSVRDLASGELTLTQGWRDDTRQAAKVCYTGGKRYQTDS